MRTMVRYDGRRLSGIVVPQLIRDRRSTEFNGTNQYAYVDNPSFKTDTAGAFFGWMYMSTALTSDGVKCLLGFGSDNATRNELALLRQLKNAAVASGQTRFEILSALNTSQQNVYGSTTLSAGTWYFVVIQSTGTAWEMYLNNTAQTLTPLSGSNQGRWLGTISSFNGTNHRLTFGCQWRQNGPLIYNDCRHNQCGYVSGRVLTSGEITSLYNGGVTLGPRSASAILGTDLKSFWTFGDRGDTASQIRDRIGSNHLTTVNSSTYV